MTIYLPTSQKTLAKRSGSAKVYISTARDGQFHFIQVLNLQLPRSHSNILDKLPFQTIVEGKKECQMAGRAVGRTWHGARTELRDMFRRKLSLSMCVTICTMPSRCQKTTLLPVRGQ
jgi:hypothetical protein